MIGSDYLERERKTDCTSTVHVSMPPLTNYHPDPESRFLICSSGNAGPHSFILQAATIYFLPVRLAMFFFLHLRLFVSSVLVFLRKTASKKTSNWPLLYHVWCHVCCTFCTPRAVLTILDVSSACSGSTPSAATNSLVFLTR